MPRKSRFISVEISIKTDHECAAFVEWFQSQGNYVDKLPCETHRWYAYFAPLPCSNADATIRHLCEGISDWPDNVRRQWNAAGIREFFVGYEIGSEPVAYLDHFSETTLKMAAEIGAGIGLALYPPAIFKK